MVVKEFSEPPITGVSENFFRSPLFAYLGDEESFYVAFSPLINAKTLQN